ncbi:MAG: potassium channel protein [Actinobacteria bacterium]|nr:potassium channel protein [Actinomycetota bacterium]
MRSRNLSQLSRRIFISAGALIMIYFLGSVGYMLIEDLTFLDALFMTTITITTVGYSLVKDLTTAGTIYTIILIIGGTGTAAYILINIGDFVLSEFLLGRVEKRRNTKMIKRLKDHYIICGLGRVGMEIALELTGNKIDFIIIDTADGPMALCQEHGWLCLKGDASNDDILLEAGIERARGLFAALDTDSENVYVTLSAKALNPEIFVVSRATIHETIGKLEKAGADRVVSPQIIGGRRMAAMALQPSVCDFMDTLMKTEDMEIQLAEIEIQPKSRIDNITIRDAGGQYAIEALIISVLEKGENISITRASGSNLMKAGQKLIAIGTREQIAQLEELASG